MGWAAWTHNRAGNAKRGRQTGFHLLEIWVAVKSRETLEPDSPGLNARSASKYLCDLHFISLCLSFSSVRWGQWAVLSSQDGCLIVKQQSFKSFRSNNLVKNICNPTHERWCHYPHFIDSINNILCKTIQLNILDKLFWHFLLATEFLNDVLCSHKRSSCN